MAVGEKLRVVGNSDALGNWDALQGVDLEWTEGHMWRASVPLPRDTKASFKFTKVNDAGVVLDWEAGEDRTLSLMDFETPVLEMHAAWGEYGVYNGLDQVPVTVCQPSATYLQYLSSTVTAQTCPLCLFSLFRALHASSFALLYLSCR